MFSSQERLGARQTVYSGDRFHHLQALVHEFQTSPDPNSKLQVLANLANFAYDPVNYEHFRVLNILDLFLDCLEEPDSRFVDFAIGGICNCSLDPQNRKCIVEKGGIPPVINCLSSPVEETVCSAIVALMYLCTSDTESEIVIPPVISCIRIHATSPRLRIQNVARVFLSDYVDKKPKPVPASSSSSSSSSSASSPTLAPSAPSIPSISSLPSASPFYPGFSSSFAAFSHPQSQIPSHPPQSQMPPYQQSQFSYSSLFSQPSSSSVPIHPSPASSSPPSVPNQSIKSVASGPTPSSSSSAPVSSSAPPSSSSSSHATPSPQLNQPSSKPSNSPPTIPPPPIIPSPVIPSHPLLPPPPHIPIPARPSSSSSSSAPALLPPPSLPLPPPIPKPGNPYVPLPPPSILGDGLLPPPSATTAMGGGLLPIPGSKSLLPTPPSLPGYQNSNSLLPTPQSKAPPRR